MTYSQRNCRLLIQQKREMNKHCLVMRVASIVHKDEKEVGEIIDALFDTIILQLHNNVRIKIRKFGQWYVEELTDRVIYNPTLGRFVTVPARKKVIFKPGSRLRLSTKHDNEQF